MTPRTDGIRMIQSQLYSAVERLQRESTHMSDARISRRMGEIERIAQDHGLTSMAHLTRAGMHAALGPGHRRALACHLERMDDAIGSPHASEDATAAIMASIAIRLR